MNDAAEVAGRSTLASGVRHAFLYSGGSCSTWARWAGRTAKPPDSMTSSPRSSGRQTSAAAGTHAFLYERGTMTDLNSRLPAGSGWVLEAATAIDDSGEIVGWGRHNGVRHAYRLSPPVKLAR